MASPRVDHQIYSRGPSAQSAWRVYEYTGHWPHELVKGFEPASWAETFTREFATLMGISHGARNVEIEDVVQRLRSSAAERKAPRNCLTRLDISQAREWLIVEKGVTTTKCKRVRHLKEESDDESGKESESEAEPKSEEEEAEDEEEEAEDEEESESDPEPLSEINVHGSDDSTSDSSSDDDDDEMEIDEPTPSVTTTTRLRNGQFASKQNKQPFPTPSLTPEDARQRIFDGLDEHYRRSVRRAAMTKKRQSKPQPQPKPQLLLTPPASGGSVPPNNKGDDRASSSSATSEPPASTDEPWSKRLCTRAGNVSSSNRPGQLESPLRRGSTTTIPDSNSESDEKSRDTAPASPAPVSSNCDEDEQSRISPAPAPATAAPPAIESSAVAPTTTTTHAPTTSNENISSTSIDSTSATGRPRRNIQLPSRIACSQPQSAVTIVEKSRKRRREPPVETREHPMSLESSSESEEPSASAMGSLAGSNLPPAASSAQHTPTAAFSSLQTGRSTNSRMSIASLLQVPSESAGAESPSPATLGRDGESFNPPQSNSAPTAVSPAAKKQKVANTSAASTSSDVHTTQPTEENSDEDLPDWDALIADWDAKAARVINAHTNIQENRVTLSEKSKYVEFLEHMQKTHPLDEDGRKHYESEKKKLGDIQFVHGIFLRGFEEAKRAAVANADPDVTLAEQARRMGANKRKRQGLTH